MPKRKKAERDARYKAFHAVWEQRRKAPDRGGGEWLVEEPKIPVDPLPLLQSLRALAYFAQDTRYMKMHYDSMTSGLIDFATNRWMFVDTKITRVLPELIEDAIADGFTERQAIAEAVAVFELYPDAQSFDAACKRLQRLMHAWRKKVGQKPT